MATPKPRLRELVEAQAKELGNLERQQQGAAVKLYGGARGNLMQRLEFLEGSADTLTARAFQRASAGIVASIGEYSNSFKLQITRIVKPAAQLASAHLRQQFAVWAQKKVPTLSPEEAAKTVRPILAAQSDARVEAYAQRLIGDMRQRLALSLQAGESGTAARKRLVAGYLGPVPLTIGEAVEHAAAASVRTALDSGAAANMAAFGKREPLTVASGLTEWARDLPKPAYWAQRVVTDAVVRASGAAAVDLIDQASGELPTIQKCWLAINDDRICPICEDLDGESIGIDEFFDADDEDVMSPPAHPNCFLAGTLVTAAGVSAHYKRWFEGEILSLVVEGHDDLAVTPNHPILTARGWVAAGKLQVGDQLVECIAPAESARLWNPDDHHIETRIEEIAGALLMAGGVMSSGVPAPAEAFHGDGIADGEVDIVLPARLLARDAKPVQRGQHGRFCRRKGAGARFSGSGPLLQFGDGAVNTSDGVVRGASPGSSLLGSGERHPNEHGLGSAPDAVPGFPERADQRHSSAPERIGDLGGRFSGEVAGMQGRHFGVSESAHDLPSLSVGSGFETEVREPSLHGPVGDTEPVRDRPEGFSGHVGQMRLAQLLLVRHRYFAGHVYNLETASGWYLANGIVTHNCRCQIAASDPTNGIMFDAVEAHAQ